jgi:hypothetical protein
MEPKVHYDRPYYTNQNSHQYVGPQFEDYNSIAHHQLRKNVNEVRYSID